MIPLLVCDDSNMARKQLIRALPPEWPVTLSQAANGEEALALVRQGQGQIMLLDLTMPVLDGYQTLAALRAEGLQSQVIVVSGDVQDEAVRRVRELGALAFIRKPADPAILRQTLIELGLFNPQATPMAQAQAAALSELKVSFRDALREVSNVAMGRAAALLAKVLGVFVQLPVPQVNLFEVSELHMTLLDAQRGERFSAICQGFIGEAIAGEALLLFHDSEVNDMARLLGWQPKNETQTSEMLLDLASILIGACLAGVAEQLDLRFSQGHPQLLGQHASLDQLIQVNRQRWRKTLAVEISYSLEGHAIHFDLLLLFTEDSIARLTAKIGYLME
ncbi:MULTISPECIES: response regulator [Pseudomonadaceae]|uniref:CheC, inhibitor of MCP methylation n=2 Tax=Ectopseudomonas TaxID=3236654 RepID=A4XYQ7_ECTM1|nr:MULTISPECIES: response regulator [Pseudomonas]ARS50538.1 chemotaxis protein CheC [Pseudomonas mendocina]EJO95597.1 CheC, inhibitor of MCP methylation [Pseudomonas mendocina DLHK]ATH80709.1 response regulator [Pseudomonas mendocina]MBF8162897.1 response regulator [Pseudomonas mendocina]MDH0099263.1 response regulator [Pseudomonas sp. GD04158]